MTEESAVSYTHLDVYKRQALVCEEEPFDFPDDVRAGDALIVFTKRAVLDIAGRLERQGIRTSVIYGLSLIHIYTRGPA